MTTENPEGARAPKADQKILADIERYGCSVVYVVGEAGQPPFYYSVGIQHSSGAPEIIVIGLKPHLAHFIVNEYNRRVRAGECFAAGQFASGFLEGFDVCFRAVHPSHYLAYFGWGLWIYRAYFGGAQFQVLQVVVPTTTGVWPWDAEASAGFRAWQPLLEEPAALGRVPRTPLPIRRPERTAG